MSLGAMGAGAAGALEELLKQKFFEQIQRAQLAQQAQRDATAGELGRGNLDVSRGNLEMRGKEFDASQQPRTPEPLKPIAVGGRIVDPATGKVIFEPPATPPAPSRPVSIAPGGRLVDPTTGKVIFAAPERPKAPKADAPAAAAAAKTEQKEQNDIEDSLALIRQIREDKARRGSTGPLEGRGLGAFRDLEGYTRVKALHDNLVNKLQLAQAGKLKGQGQISNMEREMLSKAATALQMKLGDDDYLNELAKIEAQFSRMRTGPRTPTNPPGSDKETPEQRLKRLMGGG